MNFVEAHNRLTDKFYILKSGRFLYFNINFFRLKSIIRSSFVDQITEKDETLNNVEKGILYYLTYLFIIFYNTMFHLIIKTNEPSAIKHTCK